MGTLFLVATPIGNLEDISARALRILSQAIMVAAEDTRHTRKLLGHYQIHTPLTSYHEHNKLTKLDVVMDALERGDVALVSDAGTPALNDPGFELVRAALKAGHQVSPIPGACAPVSALVASGLPTDAFLYLGYLPRKTLERRQKLQEIADLPYTLIVLETPHRLLSALQDLLEVLGDRQVAVARELTKLHEEIFRAALSQALAHFQVAAPRGEFTLVIAGKPPFGVNWDEARLRSELEEALRQGEKGSQAAARLASLSGWPRRKVYRMATEIAKTI
jgi:16S rRNA (cytidine1402-2'-O)-methyltransferase